MKRVMMKGFLVSFAVAVIAACGGNNNNNNGTVTTQCVAGQANCNLPPGSSVKYTGQMYNVNASGANTVQKVYSGSIWCPAVNIDSGNLEVTAQGLPDGTTSYFVAMTLIPRSTSPFWNFGVTQGPSCNQPILINGTAAAYTLENNQQMLQLRQGGLTFNITASGTTANPFVGTDTTLSSVSIKLVNVGQDPTQGSAFANSTLNKMQYNPYNYGVPYGQQYGAPNPYGQQFQQPYNPYGYRPY